MGKNPKDDPATQEDRSGSFAELEKKLLAVQQLLATETVEVSVGRGAIQVVVNGQQEVQAMKISSDAMALEADALSELVVTAVNQAIKKSQELASARLSSTAGDASRSGLR